MRAHELVGLGQLDDCRTLKIKIAQRSAPIAQLDGSMRSEQCAPDLGERRSVVQRDYVFHALDAEVVEQPCQVNRGGSACVACAERYQDGLRESFVGEA